MNWLRDSLIFLGGAFFAIIFWNVIVLTQIDFYEFQKNYAEQANAGFLAGFDAGSDFQECFIVDTNYSFNYCQEKALRESCDWGIASYLTHCIQLQEKDK